MRAGTVEAGRHADVDRAVEALRTAAGKGNQLDILDRRGPAHVEERPRNDRVAVGPHVVIRVLIGQGEVLALNTEGRAAIEPHAGLHSAAAHRLVVNVLVSEEDDRSGRADVAGIIGVRPGGDQGRHVRAFFPPLQVIGLDPDARRPDAEQRPARSPAGFIATDFGRTTNCSRPSQSPSPHVSQPSWRGPIIGPSEIMGPSSIGPCARSRVRLASPGRRSSPPAADLPGAGMAG